MTSFESSRLFRFDAAFNHDAVDAVIDSPYSLNFFISSHHGYHFTPHGHHVAIAMHVSVLLDVAQFFLVLHYFGFRFTSGEFDNDRLFMQYLTFWYAYIYMSFGSICTPMSRTIPITTSSVFSFAFSGTPWKRIFSQQLFCSIMSCANACDCTHLGEGGVFACHIVIV